MKTAQAVAAEAYQVIGALAEGPVFDSPEVQQALDYFHSIAQGETEPGEVLPWFPPETPDLHGFVLWIYTHAWPHGDADGGDLQEKGVEFGILRPETVTESCGEYCGCAEWDDFPQTCYKLNIGEQQ